MNNGRAKRHISIFIVIIMICSLTTIVAPMVSAEVMPGTGVTRANTPVTMDNGTQITETVTLQCVGWTSGNMPPPAPGAEINFDYSGNTIRTENANPGTTYCAGGGWIKWAGVDLKGGVASYKLCIASNGASRTFDVRISRPGEGFNAAVSLGTLPVNGLATNWTMRWVRFPSANITGQSAPFIHANTNSYNTPAEQTNWATITDSKLDGICDVYFVYPSQDTQMCRVSLTLKGEPTPPAPPYDGNVVFNVSPSAGATVTLQNLATGAALTPAADGVSFADVAVGSYGYIVRSAGYYTKIGTLDVTGAHTAAAPLIKSLLLWPRPATSLNTLNLLSSPWNDLNDANNNGTPSWSSGSYIEFISTNTWFKWNNVDLKGGIASWESNIASGNAGTYSIDVRVAPTGSTPTGSSPNKAIPSTAQSLGVQNIAVASGGGWGAPGVTARYPASGDITNPLRTGLSDVYVRCSGGDFNLGRVTLNLKDDASVPAPDEIYDVIIAARPSDAAVTVKSLDGNTTYAPKADGKTYSLSVGFYKYSASLDGHVSKVDQVFMVDRAKKIFAVLIPSGGQYSRFEAENIASASRPGSTILSDALYSNGQAITLGSATNNWATFSGLEIDYSGIAEVKVFYSGVTSGYINIKPNDEPPRTVALDASGMITVYMDVLNGNNSLRVSAVPSGFILDCIDVWSLTTAGSVDPNEMDEPYIPPKNPIIRSLFTADPEAHVWPTNPDKLMIYASHDRFPQSGCDRMDMYHVWSTTNLINIHDEGEILRRNDLPSWAIKNTGVNAASFMWAPDAAYYDGYYYFYNPVPRNTGSWGSTWETSVVRSIYPDRDFEQIPAEDVDANAGKPWSGFLRDSGATDGYSNMYDIAVRVYDDRIYVYNGASQTLWQCEMKSDMVTVVGGRMQLVSTNNQTTANNNGDPAAFRRCPDYHEGPSAFRRNGIYYLIYPGSSGSYGGLSGDSFHYMTGPGPLGPWTHRGIFFNPHGNTTSHGSIVEFKGEYYWVYHTGDLPGGTDQIRSVCIDKVVFDDSITFADGTKGAIVRFSKTSGSVPGLTDVEYEKPTGVMYGPTEEANANVTWGANVTKNKDAAAGNGGWVLNNVGGAANAASSVTFTFNLEKAQRAMLRFHYSTTNDMPKLNITINGVDHNTLNFMKTGARSFYADVEFTPRRLQAGTNTVVLGGAGAATSTQTGGNIRLNYIEVIPLDEVEPTGIEVRRSGSHVSVINYEAKGTDPIDTVLILALYDASGKLVYVGSEAVSVEPKRAKTVVFDVDLSDFVGCTAKTFAWDPVTFVPFADSEHTSIQMHNEYELGYKPNTP